MISLFFAYLKKTEAIEECRTVVLEKEGDEEEASIDGNFILCILFIVFSPETISSNYVT